MINLRGRLQTWFQRWRSGTHGAIPSHAQLMLESTGLAVELSRPPPVPSEELLELESDIVVVESEPDPDLRIWSEAFAAATKGQASE